MSDEPMEGQSPDEVAALLTRRAERFAQRPDEEDADTVQVIAFSRGETRYGVLLAETLEIRPLKNFCRIPGASPVIPGVFYHRGKTLSGHDLRPFLGGGDEGEDATWVVVCVHDGHRFGVIADGVSDVQDIPRSEIQPMPLSFGGRRDCFQGLARSSILILDLRALLADRDFFESF